MNASKFNVLLIDDVSVTGKTIGLAKEVFKDFNVKTFVLVGEADYVLFPDIRKVSL